MTDWLQPLTTALAGAAAIAAVSWTVSRDRHPLAMVERLTSIAADVRSDAVRQLVEDERDRRATRWVLERRAPTEARARAAGVVLFCIGSFCLLVWVASAFIDRWAAWAWISYGAGLALVLVSRAVLGIRAGRRRAWMDQERSWRHLPTEDRAQRAPENRTQTRQRAT